MKKNKISVIVPVYNTSKYLDKCLNSLLNQTYNNIEIVIIEDCSTDNSKEVLKKYEKNKNTKIVYNKKNHGLSYARNIGIKESTGEYIGFVDSDDYVDLDFYERLMKSIIENKSDIAVCDIKVCYVDKNIEEISRCYTGDEFNLYSVVNNGLAASACNKLFKKNAISKYSFADGKVNEDIAVVIPALVNAEKISYANTYYYYIQRSGSIQNSCFSDKRFDIFYGVDTTLERIKNSEQYEKLKDALIFNQIIVLLLYVIPKEKKFIKRYNSLKKFNELSKKYTINKNACFWQFLRGCGKKHQLYYQLLVKMNCKGLYFLSDLLTVSCDIFAIFFKKKTVLNSNINLSDVICMAKKQSLLKEENIKLSVVVPNYNYEKFIYQRMYSILRQNYKIYELIILDDCSKDDSRKLIDELVDSIKDYVKIKKIYNDTNSGSVFKQWQKGFDLAKGDYVWIAEADDYCESNLLKELVKSIKKNKDIMISYCDTAFIDVSGNIIIKSIKSEIDIQKSGHWNKSYINNGINEIKDYSYLNCTVANVSSCIIKNGNYDEYFKISGEYKQAGDWLFYVNVIKNGYISYSNKTLNYYRMHGNNVSSTIDKKRHIEEIKKIHSYCKKEFNLDDNCDKMMLERINFLKRVWKVK